MKVARVTHSFAHRKSGKVQGSELGFYSLPTNKVLVTTTTFIYISVSTGELTHNQMERGAA
jgi:hypothetical protein